MATLADSPPEHIESIDPRQEPVFPEFSFTIPTPIDIDWEEVILSYDRLSDILLVFVVDRSQPAIVVYDDVATWPCLVNPDTMQFVGWQMESFLTTAVRHNPDFINLLDHAELIGLTANELRDERQRVLGYRGQIRAWLGRAIAALRHRRTSRKEDIVRSLFTGTHSPLTHSPSFGT